MSINIRAVKDVLLLDSTLAATVMVRTKNRSVRSGVLNICYQ